MRACSAGVWDEKHGSKNGYNLGLLKPLQEKHAQTLFCILPAETHRCYVW